MIKFKASLEDIDQEGLKAMEAKYNAHFDSLQLDTCQGYKIYIPFDHQEARINIINGKTIACKKKIKAELIKLGYKGKIVVNDVELKKERYRGGDA